MKRHLENEAMQALRETLGQVSVIKIREIKVDEPRPRGERDIIAHVEIYGHDHKLVCKLAGSSNKHDVDRAFEELRELHAGFQSAITPVLIAPSLSEEAQDNCRQSNTGFLDLEGNARLYLDEVFIVKRSLPLHRSIPPRAEPLPNSETARIANYEVCAGVPQPRR